MKTHKPDSTTPTLVDRESPLFAAEAAIVSHRLGPLENAQLHSVEVESLNGAGDIVARNNVQIEVRREDVVGILPYSISNQEVTVYATECLRPALAGRSLVGLPPLADDRGCRVINELGGYLVNVDGLAERGLQLVEQKSDLKVIPESIDISRNVLYPNPSIARELSVPLKLRAEPPVMREALLDGDSFDASRVRVALPATEVIGRFFSGNLGDLRFVEDTIELVVSLCEDKLCSQKIEAPRVLRAQVQSRIEGLRAEYGDDLPILRSAEDVRKFIEPLNDPTVEAPPMDPRIVTAVRVPQLPENPAPLPSNALFVGMNLNVQNRNSSGSPVGDPYPVDAIVRTRDVVHLVVLTKDGFIPVNIGARAALEVRESAFVHTRTHARNLENPWGSFNGSYNDRVSMTEQIREIVRRRTGHELSGDPIFTDIQGYNSPGFNTSGFRYAICFIDLDKDSADRLPPDTALTTPATLLEAQVRDLPLRVTARIASMVLGQEMKAAPSILEAPERVKFRSIILRNGEFDQYLREYSPKLRELMAQDPLIDSINNLLVRTEGWEIEGGGKETGQPENDEDAEEALFFNSQMQRFSIHKGAHPLEVVQLIWHDFWHYRHKDPLPFERDPITGKLQLVPFEVYLKAVMRNEINALMFSDVVFPTKYGLDEFETKLGNGDPKNGRSLARLLKNSGLETIEEQHAAIEMGLKRGELHPAIVRFLKESGTLKEYERVICEKLLGYYVRDTLQNVRIQYDSWAEIPDVAEVPVRLGLKFPSQIEDTPFNKLKDRLTHDVTGRPVVTGRNNLSEAIGKVKTYSVYPDALRLSFLASRLEAHGRFEVLPEVRDTIEKLIHRHSQLAQVIEGITSIEETEYNANAFRLMEQVKNGIAKDAPLLIKRLLLPDEGLFPEEERKKIEKRIQHLPFPRLPFDALKSQAARDKVNELLHRAMAA